MKIRLLYGFATLGILLGLLSAFLYSRQPKALPPAYTPASNPYPEGIYANGIIESSQDQGENINLFPEVSGPVTRILVREGASVRQGDPLLTIDDSVQRALAQQQRAQAAAALALLDELRAEPRPEVLRVALAQVESAQAALKNAADQRGKVERSFELEPQSVSRDVLDNARNSEAMAQTNLQVARRQCDLTRAGAWSFDVRNQESQYAALDKAAAAAEALLAKYTVRAPVDGQILAVQAALGSYVSPQGAYGSYTEGFSAVVVMGAPQKYLQVRCFVDEILVPRLPPRNRIQAQLSIHGTNISLPIEFVRLQPYVSPKIELTDQREEQVDVRVLPVIFRFEKPANLNLYPGQMVDVYVAAK